MFQWGKNDKIVEIWGLIIRTVRCIDMTKYLLDGVLVSLAIKPPLERWNLEAAKKSLIQSLAVGKTDVSLMEL